MPLSPWELATVGTQSVEEEIAAIVVGQVKPNLRQQLTELNALSADWNAPGNGIPAKIVAAATAQENLAGFHPNTWVVWGNLLLALQAWLDTSIEITLPDTTTYTTTPRNILLTRDVKQP